MGKIPKDIRDSLDINKKEVKKTIEVNAVVEEHQAKLPIPKTIRLKLNIEKIKNQKSNEYKKYKFTVTCNPKTKEIIYKLK